MALRKPLTEAQQNTRSSKRLIKIISFWLRKREINSLHIEQGIFHYILRFHGVPPVRNPTATLLLAPIHSLPQCTVRMGELSSSKRHHKV